jgi:hypothetical protein
MELTFSVRVVTKLGYFNPFLILGLVLTSIGCGLLTTLQIGSGEGAWIGYQIICGLGFGLVVQMVNLFRCGDSRMFQWSNSR